MSMKEQSEIMLQFEWGLTIVWHKMTGFYIFWTSKSHILSLLVMDLGRGWAETEVNLSYNNIMPLKSEFKSPIVRGKIKFTHVNMCTLLGFWAIYLYTTLRVKGTLLRWPLVTLSMHRKFADHLKIPWYIIRLKQIWSTKVPREEGDTGGPKV